METAYLEPEWRRPILNQIADPEALRRLDKRYELDRTDRVGLSDHLTAFRYAKPAVQLPVPLHETFWEAGRYSVSRSPTTWRLPGLIRNYPYQAAWTQVTHHPRREPS